MLTFGYNAGLVDGLRAALGARWIVNQDGMVDQVWDRLSWDGDLAALDELDAWVNAKRPEFDNVSPWQRAKNNASRFLIEGIALTREARPLILHQDGDGAVVANTNGSAGYMYVAAYMYKHLPEGHGTLGLEKVLSGR